MMEFALIVTVFLLKKAGVNYDYSNVIPLKGANYYTWLICITPQHTNTPL